MKVPVRMELPLICNVPLPLMTFCFICIAYFIVKSNLMMQTALIIGIVLLMTLVEETFVHHEIVTKGLVPPPGAIVVAVTITSLSALMISTKLYLL